MHSPQTASLLLMTLNLFSRPDTEKLLVHSLLVMHCVLRYHMAIVQLFSKSFMLDDLNA